MQTVSEKLNEMQKSVATVPTLPYRWRKITHSSWMENVQIIFFFFFFFFQFVIILKSS